MRSGAGGLTSEAPGAFDTRQWQHQVRTAQALIAAPESLPLLSRGAHQVVIGSTGTGKTTLYVRPCLRPGG